MSRKRLLLINPTYGVSFWGFEYSVGLAGLAYSIAPLGVVTIAALTPDDWEVRVVDESVEPIDLDAECDVVGISAMNVQAARAFDLAAEFRRRGRTVVIGGPFATLEPDRCAPHADVVVVGEAERTWPAFCRDFVRGEHKARYDEPEKIDLSTSPTPRYDLLKRGAYGALPVQTTRGCPFSCEFCDIIVMHGRRVRSKPVPQVLEELRAARTAGAEVIFFTDDNFIGNQRYAKDLLRGIIDMRARTGFRPMLYTQASVNVAEKPALLALLVEAGFTRLFLGIESPRQSSLQESGKRQNTHGDLLARIHAIQESGLIVWAGMIVGFDHDDGDIFEEHAEFLDKAGIAVAMVGMLNAPPRTPLHERLERAGRIHPTSDWADNCAWTNIVPKQMGRAELFSGYASLIRHLYDQENYTRRLMSNVARMRPPQAGDTGARTPTLGEIKGLVRATAAFSFSRDPIKRRHFVPNLLRTMIKWPARVTETTIHLALWQHYAKYVPELAHKLEAAAAAERVLLREVRWAERARPTLAAVPA